MLTTYWLEKTSLMKRLSPKCVLAHKHTHTHTHTSLMGSFLVSYKPRKEMMPRQSGVRQGVNSTSFSVEMVAWLFLNRRQQEGWNPIEHFSLQQSNVYPRNSEQEVRRGEDRREITSQNRTGIQHTSPFCKGVRRKPNFKKSAHLTC